MLNRITRKSKDCLASFKSCLCSTLSQNQTFNDLQVSKNNKTDFEQAFINSVYSAPLYSQRREITNQKVDQKLDKLYYQFPEDYKPYNPVNYWGWGAFLAFLTFSLYSKINRLLLL